MIVYDLKCARGHVFEGWFGDAADFGVQAERGLLMCAVCDSGEIERLPSRLAIGGAVAPTNEANDRHVQVSASVPTTNAPDTTPDDMPSFDPALVKKAMSAIAKAESEAVAKSDYVGAKFADEARAMHYGEQPARPVYGETTTEQAKSLHEEGVPAQPLLFPVKARANG
ncbi:MAG: DUF1178 family protein [Pacificimonas sp.]